MSRSPTDLAPPAVSRWPTGVPLTRRWPTGLALTRRWPTGLALARRWRRLLGRVPRHTLYLQPEGLWAWRDDRSAAAAPAFFDSFPAWCQAHPGGDARLLLAGRLVHHLVVDPALGLRGEPAVRAYAIQQFSHYYGSAAHDWPLALAMASSSASASASASDGGCSVVCAAHALSIDALRSSAASHGIGLLGAAPVWSAGLASLSAQVASFGPAGRRPLALLEGSFLTWLRPAGDAPMAIEQRRLDAPRSGHLAAMLQEQVGASDRLSELDRPILVGWGLEDPENAARLPAEVLGSLGTVAGFGRWVLDAMDSPP